MQPQPKNRCPTCGHDMLSEEDVIQMFRDATYPMSVLVRNELHNRISIEGANQIAEYLLKRAMVHLVDFMEQDIPNLYEKLLAYRIED